MPNETPVVEARPSAATPPEQPSASGVELDDSLLKIPAMQALVAGTPPAFSALLADFEKQPEAKIIASNKDSLMKAGFGLYRSQDGSTGVVFNQLFMSPDEIQAADQAGQLGQIAPPFDQLNASVGSSGAANPVLAENERPTGFKSGGAAPVSALPTTSSVKPMSSGAQRTLASKRATNLQPGAPTSGASPGGGALLRSIMKPVL